MHTESQIRAAIKPLLQRYGSLNTTEIVKLFKEEIPLDAEDLRRSPTRPGELMVEQNIRNSLTRHVRSGETTHYFGDGFIVDKSKRPAVCTVATIERDGTIVVLDNKKITAKKRTAKKFKKLLKTLTDEEREQLNRSRSRTGLNGELLVLNSEIEKVRHIDPLLTGQVIHASQISDCFGYDISSIDSLKKEIYIEVKTTKLGVNEPFFISKNEINFLKLHKKHSFIYRVYNFDNATKTGSIKIIKATDLFDKTKYRFNPISYKVEKV